MPFTRGFHGRRSDVDPSRLPPGQYETKDFPVLSAGPTPHAPLADWTFTVDGAVGQSRRWTWEEFTSLASEMVTVDIHCVTKWSKFDTSWTGVPVAALIDGTSPTGAFVVAWSDGGYTTNLPLADVLDGKAWIAYRYADAPLEAEHGGPARLLVPHLYFWKSAKWVRGLTITEHDEPGFWEGYGYHNYGDPWKEQRYWSD